MPRKQKAPANPGRPDLQQRQPVRTPTGLPYGENIALEQSQQAAPLNAAPPPPTPEQTMAAAQGMNFPAASLGDRTNRPNEPLTAGLAVGPGPGPEVLTRPPGAPTVAATLMRLAVDSGDTELIAMAQLAREQGA